MPQSRKAGDRATAEAPSARSLELSEFEYGLIISGNAFAKWATRCMSAAGVGGLGAHDALLLHAVNHRARDRKLGDICMVMNIEDRHVVSYALKKLMDLGLVEAHRRGRDNHYVTTPAGDDACRRYRKIREQFMVRNLAWLPQGNNAVTAAASFLRAMTALYEQAERMATVDGSEPKGSGEPLSETNDTRLQRIKGSGQPAQRRRSPES